MRTTITRKLTETKITGYAVKIQEGGNPEFVNLEPITVYGNVSEGVALKELKKAYPDMQGVTVARIQSEEVQYEISVEDFVKYATRIEPNKEEKEND